MSKDIDKGLAAMDKRLAEYPTDVMRSILAAFLVGNADNQLLVAKTFNSLDCATFVHHNNRLIVLWARMQKMTPMMERIRNQNHRKSDEPTIRKWNRLLSDINRRTEAMVALADSPHVQKYIKETSA